MEIKSNGFYSSLAAFFSSFLTTFFFEHIFLLTFFLLYIPSFPFFNFQPKVLYCGFNRFVIEFGHGFVDREFVLDDQTWKNNHFSLFLKRTFTSIGHRLFSCFSLSFLERVNEGMNVSTGVYCVMKFKLIERWWKE